MTLALSCACSFANINIEDPLFRPKASCDYLIIAPDMPGILVQLEPLAISKREKGYQTRIVTLDRVSQESGDDLPEKIRSFIGRAYREWGVTWVLLAGDYSLLPARKVSTGNYFPATAVAFDSDIYYSCLDGAWDADNDLIFGNEKSETTFRLLCGFNESGEFVCDSVYPQLQGLDLWPDVYIGRFPVSNAEETRIMVEKTLRYEREPRSGGKSNDILFFGPKIHYRVPRDASGSVMVTDAAKFWHSEVVPALGGNHSRLRHSAIEEVYEDHVDNMGVLVPDSLLVTRDLIHQQLSQGYNLVFFSCHGHISHIQISSRQPIVYTYRDALQLESPTSSHVVSISCKVMQLPADSAYCFAKGLLVNPNGGAVTYSGSSEADYFSSKRKQYLKAVEHLARGRTSRIAKAFQNANLTLDRYNRFVHQFWGDPELPLHMRPLTDSDTIGVQVERAGNRLIIRTTPALDNALVCVLGAGTEFVREFTRDGEARLETPVEGDAVLTVSHDDYLPTRMVLNAGEFPVAARPAPARGRQAFVAFAKGGSIFWKSAQSRQGAVRVRDCAGRVVYSHALQSGYGIVSGLASGIYLAEFETSTRRQTIRITVAR